MHFTEFALVPGSEGSFRGKKGEIAVFIRIILDDQPHLFFVGIQNFLDGRTDLDTVQSLVINKFDNCNRRVCRTTGW
jgi:hypothetical protein